jgi:hypothetical protein
MSLSPGAISQLFSQEVPLTTTVSRARVVLGYALLYLYTVLFTFVWVGEYAEDFASFAIYPAMALKDATVNMYLTTLYVYSVAKITALISADAATTMALIFAEAATFAAFLAWYIAIAMAATIANAATFASGYIWSLLLASGVPLFYAFWVVIPAAIIYKLTWLGYTLWTTQSPLRELVVKTHESLRAVDGQWNGNLIPGFGFRTVLLALAILLVITFTVSPLTGS